MFIELHKIGTEQPVLINSTKVSTIHKRFIPDVFAPHDDDGEYQLKEEGTQIFVDDDPDPFNIMEPYEEVREIFANINISTGGIT